eukprot:TCONS_00025276-protein
MIEKRDISDAERGDKSVDQTEQSHQDDSETITNYTGIRDEKQPDDPKVVNAGNSGSGESSGSGANDFEEGEDGDEANVVNKRNQILQDEEVQSNAPEMKNSSTQNVIVRNQVQKSDLAQKEFNRQSPDSTNINHQRAIIGDWANGYQKSTNQAVPPIKINAEAQLASIGQPSNTESGDSNIVPPIKLHAETRSPSISQPSNMDKTNDIVPPIKWNAETRSASISSNVVNADHVVPLIKVNAETIPSKSMIENSSNISPSNVKQSTGQSLMEENASFKPLSANTATIQQSVVARNITHYGVNVLTNEEQSHVGEALSSGSASGSGFEAVESGSGQPESEQQKDDQLSPSTMSDASEGNSLDKDEDDSKTIPSVLGNQGKETSSSDSESSGEEDIENSISSLLQSKASTDVSESSGELSSGDDEKSGEKEDSREQHNAILDLVKDMAQSAAEESSASTPPEEKDSDSGELSTTSSVAHSLNEFPSEDGKNSDERNSEKNPKMSRDPSTKAPEFENAFVSDSDTFKDSSIPKTQANASPTGSENNLTVKPESTQGIVRAVVNEGTTEEPRGLPPTVTSETSVKTIENNERKSSADFHPAAPVETASLVDNSDEESFESNPANDDFDSSVVKKSSIPILLKSPDDESSEIEVLTDGGESVSEIAKRSDIPIDLDTSSKLTTEPLNPDNVQEKQKVPMEEKGTQKSQQTVDNKLRGSSAAKGGKESTGDAKLSTRITVQPIYQSTGRVSSKDVSFKNDNHFQAKEALYLLVRSILDQDNAVRSNIDNLSSKRFEEEEKLERDLIDLVSKDESNNNNDETKEEIITDVKDYEGFVRALSLKRLPSWKHDVIVKKLENDLLHHLGVSEADAQRALKQTDELTGFTEAETLKGRLERLERDASSFATKHSDNLDMIRNYVTTSLNDIIYALPLKKSIRKELRDSITKSAWMKMLTSAKQNRIILRHLKRTLRDLE